MRLDRLEQVRGSPVVEKEDALPQTPQGCGPELIALRPALDDLVSEFTGALPRDDVKFEAWVELIVAVWQVAQPMALNSRRPLAIEVVPPGVVVEGVGGASKRMNIANITVSLGMEAFVANWSEPALAAKLVVSFG